MKRPLVLLVALVVALVGSGCGSGGNTVRGSSTLNDAANLRFTLSGSEQTRHVSRDQLLSEVGNLIADKPFATFLKQQKFTIDKDLSADSRLTAIWLSQLIQQQAIDALFASRHLKITPALHAQATTNVVQTFPAPEIFPAFPAQFRATLIDRQARTDALIASYTDTSDAAGQAYFRAHESELGCASGKNVAHILVATQAAAQGIIDQLAGGASFATLAAQDSTDKQSGAQGGSLGCLAKNEFVAAFQKAADAAPIGTPVGPVHSSFGYHVILVTKATTTYAGARTQVLEALRAQGSQSATTAITALLKKLKVHLDARFGKWGPVTSSQGGTSYQVSPPAAPPVATSRDGAGTTTTVPTSTTAPAAPTGSP